MTPRLRLRKKTLIDVCRWLCVVSVVVNGFFYPPSMGRLQFVAHGAICQRQVQALAAGLTDLMAKQSAFLSLRSAMREGSLVPKRVNHERCRESREVPKRGWLVVGRNLRGRMKIDRYDLRCQKVSGISWSDNVAAENAAKSSSSIS